ncbi:MAG TPA: hypothetical protein VHI10_07195 [Mycobacterium sp.]|nr:hypothetical protein [Mycobacterium sp.]
MLTTVTDAVVPLAHVPSDLYALLGVPAAGQPLIGTGGAPRAAPFAANDAAPLLGPQASLLAEILPARAADMPLFGRVVSVPMLGAVAATGFSQELSLSGLTPLAPGVGPADARSLLEHVISAVLVPASLTALAALALPGAGGLLVVCAAGIRVGYRQAKAGSALRASGIARFAGPGPLGVVRSGSLIALRTRPSRALRQRPRAARPTVSREASILERVA